LTVSQLGLVQIFSTHAKGLDKLFIVVPTPQVLSSQTPVAAFLSFHGYNVPHAV